MIAAWMLFSVMTDCALTATAVAVDRIASLSRRPRRFIWLSALVATTCWPVISLVRSALLAWSDAPKAVVLAGVHLPTVFVFPAMGWTTPHYWTSGIIVAWAVCSSLLLMRLALAVRYLRQQRASWPAIQVDGMSVHLSSEAGPAVVGLHQMKVVLPAWVLEMDRPLRTLVLRHEAEHRSARDPYLLLVATVLTALIPWNVALWFQARRLRLAIEIDCDRRVLHAHPSWPEYAHLLLTIAQRRGRTVQRLTPALSEPTSNLERRIATMSMKPTLSRFHVVCLGLVATGAFALACTVATPDSPERLSRSQSVTGPAKPNASAQSLDPERSTFFEFQVDKPATPSEPLRLQYPASLKGSRIGGEVQAQFVVNQDGRVDMSSFKMLNTPDPRFVAAVKAVLPTYRLEPATVHGRPVRQLVQQAFVFEPPR